MSSFTRNIHPIILSLLLALTAATGAYAQSVTASVAAGTSPIAVAINPVTNKIYVANEGSSDVTVIDGATNTVVATVMAGTTPFAVAINPVTNKIYVANRGSDNVTVIDGATNTVVTTVVAGTSPRAVAINPVTNKIYVANQDSANVTVINGANNTVVTTVASGSSPTAVAVNPVTNKIYVANFISNNVTVIDGATNTITTVAVGTGPRAIAINPVTNKIYVTNGNNNNVTVIDGATNSVTTVGVGINPRAIAINPVTNKIYVAIFSSANVTVIDGATNTVVTTVAAGTEPRAVAINPVTNKIYVANFSSTVTVIDAAPSTFTQHRTSVAMPGGNVTSRTNPTLSLTVSGAYSPTDPAVRTVYYRLNDSQGAFTAATGSGPFTAALSGLAVGFNTVSLFAVDAMEGTSINTAGGGFGGTSSMIGAPSVFAFTVVAPPVISTASPLTAGTFGLAYSQSIAASGGAGALAFTVTAGALPGGLTLSSAGLLSGSPTALGAFNFTVTVTDTIGSTVSKAFALTIAQTQTVTFTPATPVAFGVGPITLTATASSGLTAFTFSTSSLFAICTVVGNQLTVVGGGTCALRATQSGNSNFASAFANANVVINQATQTVTFAPPTPVTFGAEPSTLTATASSGLTAFTFSTSSAGTICTVAGNQLTVVGVGTCALTATQSGNSNFASAFANANVDRKSVV